ncbi:hypothetical protein QP028_12665 [Corynebacterium suedekumii]|nr:hypothetical protein QP028_12665 [Corynebacterium suedekumii]
MQFTYVTYIFGTTPQRVYQALTERADYDAYLGTTGPQSTWAVGEVFWKSLPEGDFEDLGQEVLEADPGVALAYRGTASSRRIAGSLLRMLRSRRRKASAASCGSRLSTTPSSPPSASTSPMRVSTPRIPSCSTACPRGGLRSCPR